MILKMFSKNLFSTEFFLISHYNQKKHLLPPSGVWWPVQKKMKDTKTKNNTYCILNKRFML